MEERRFSDVGGTPGGLGHFVLGFAMACAGAYLLLNHVVVAGSYWSFYGPGTFGITLIPMLIGIALLFWNGRSVLGWLLTCAGALFIVVGVIGAFLGGWLLPALGIQLGGDIGTFIAALVGAMILLFLVGIVRRA